MRAQSRRQVQRRKVTIITYHDPQPETFDAYVSVLKRLYNIVSLAMYVDAMREGTVGKLPPKALIITLDDGHRGNHALRSVLDKHQVSVSPSFLCSGLVDTQRRFWFQHDAVRTNRAEPEGTPRRGTACRAAKRGVRGKAEFVERQALSRGELEELRARNVGFQSHSVFHPILPRYARARAEAEITQSKRDLQTKLATEVYAFAYPNRSYAERELQLVKDAGYRCAVTLNAGFNSEATPPFRLRRISLTDASDRHELLVKTSGLWGAIRAVLGDRHPIIDGYFDVSGRRRAS
jgi:peptidoglycan/xylan/chitin deacetylase (PgdA/CDA1 family)